MSLLETDLAYIAGLIDGEGCLHINRRRAIGKRKTPTYGITITIVNTNLAILEWIQSIHGGSIHKFNNAGTNWKDRYCLYFAPLVTAKLLDQIYPYLKIKRQQANVLRELSGLRERFPKRRNPVGVGFLQSSEEYLNLQENCRQKMKKLNYRGRPEQDGLMTNV